MTGRGSEVKTLTCASVTSPGLTPCRIRVRSRGSAATPRNRLTGRISLIHRTSDLSGRTQTPLRPNLQAGGHRFDPGTLHQERAANAALLLSKMVTKWSEKGVWSTFGQLPNAEADRGLRITHAIALLSVSKWLGVVRVVDMLRVTRHRRRDDDWQLRVRGRRRHGPTEGLSLTWPRPAFSAARATPRSFDEASDALECALAMRKGFRSRNESASTPLGVRIGLAAGEPVDRDGDLFGPTVNLASRLCAASDPDSVLVSEGVQEAGSSRGWPSQRLMNARLRGSQDRCVLSSFTAPRLTPKTDGRSARTGTRCQGHRLGESASSRGAVHAARQEWPASDSCGEACGRRLAFQVAQTPPTCPATLQFPEASRFVSHVRAGFDASNGRCLDTPLDVHAALFSH